MQNTKTERTRGVFVLVSITALWGVSFPLVEEVVAGRTQGQILYFLFLRFSLAALGFFPLLRHLVRATVKAGSGAWARAILVGCVLFGAYYLQTWGMQHTSASRSAFVTMLSVPMVPLLAALRDRKWPSMISLSGALLATFGTGMVLAPEGTLQPNFGDMLTLFAAVLLAIEILLLEWATRHAPTSIVAVGQILGVAVLAGMACLVVPLEIPAEWPGLLKGVAITGLVCTTLALGGMTWGQARVPAETAAVIFALEPIFTVLFVWAYLGLGLSAFQVLGAGVVFASVVWATRASGREQA